MSQWTERIAQRAAEKKGLGVVQALECATTSTLELIMTDLNLLLACAGLAAVDATESLPRENAQGTVEKRGLYPVVSSLIAMEMASADQIGGQEIAMRDRAKLAAFAQVNHATKLEALTEFLHDHPQLKSLPECADVVKLFEFVATRAFEHGREAALGRPAPMQEPPRGRSV